MAEPSLEERFADLGQWAAPTFRPALVPEVARRATRRRLRRRALVAMGIALALAVPAAAIVLQGRLGGEPIVGPTATPQASAPPSPGVPTRRIEFPGGLFPQQRFSVQWVDRDHAWLFADCATALNQVDCTYALAATSDGGRTWQRVALPEGVKRQEIGVSAADAKTLFVLEPGKGLWMSKDGGANYAYSKFSEGSPVEWSVHAEGPYHMQCNNRMNWDQDQDTGQCKFKRLVRSGGKPTPHQPPWKSLDTRVIGTGPDGRIWLSHPRGVAYSADEGKTWKETLAQNLNGDMVFSPNGRHAYMSYNTVHWHLSGDTWRQVTLPAGMRFSNSMVPLDDGRLIAGNVLGIGFLHPDGGYTPIAGVLNAEPSKVLRDGTIVLSYQAAQLGAGGLYLGITEGATTNWTMFAYGSGS